MTKRTEVMSEASRINGHVERLEKQAESAESDQFAEILREVDRSRLHLEKLASQVEAARPELLAEIKRITEIVGDQASRGLKVKDPLAR